MTHESTIDVREAEKKINAAHTRLRRLLMRWLTLALVMGAAFFLYGRYTQTHYKTTFYRETSEKVSRNIRLAVVSDLHNREYGENNEALVSDLQALHPDLILFPGDMVIREDDDYRQMLDTVSALAGIAPCYGVLGNHESERIYFRGDRALPDRFENAGLRLLRNSRADIRIGEDTVQLIGLEGQGLKVIFPAEVLEQKSLKIQCVHVLPVTCRNQNWLQVRYAAPHRLDRLRLELTRLGL